jgi:hypothetical protein
MDHGASAARGGSIYLSLRNNARTTARFALLGRVSKPIAPDGTSALLIYLARRGAYVARVELASRRTLRVTFIVY